jgi:hypothetical protein
VDYAYPSQQWRQSGLSSMSRRRLALRAHFGRLNSDQDPPFLNPTCAKPISFHLSPTWMIACGASSCTTPIARRCGIFHALELIEKPAPICVCSAFGHGAEATPRPCQAQSERRSARSRAASS